MKNFIRGIERMCTLMVVDLVAFYSALFIAWAIRAALLPYLFPGLPVFTFSFVHFVSFWWMPAVFLFFIFYENLYHSNLPFWDEAKLMVKAVSLAVVALMVVVTLGRMSDIVSRIVIVGLWVFSLFTFPLARFWGKKSMFSSGVWKERVIILGAGNAGRLVASGLQRESHMGYDVVGFLDDDEKKLGMTVGGKKVMGELRDFQKFMKDYEINTAIIAMPSLPPEKLSSLVADVQNYAVNTMVIPQLKGIALLNTDLFHLFTEEMFVMNIRNNLKSPANRFIKRLFDLVVGVTFLPFLMIFIAFTGLLIRLESRGPAIYAHDRVGRNGKIFRCYKFRTMREDAEQRLKHVLEQNEDLRVEWENNWKLRDDPRVTRIGRFLRKSSLDELPQIFNVLKGEMSLVGPRPYLPREVAEIRESIRSISTAKPGITGLWQVSGRSDTDYRHRIKLDAWYTINWSLWLDIAILFKTLQVVTKAEGAY
jgi:Undecaprenyl-phosphate galactose phosphotransferase WbaP